MNKVLRDQVLQLSDDEKVELIIDTLDSLAPQDFPPLTDEQKAELDRRMAEHERDPSSARDWKDVKADLEARYRK